MRQDGQLLLPDEFSPERAESLVGTVGALLDTVANQDHPIVEGEIPFFGLRFEGPVSARDGGDSEAQLARADAR